MVDTKQLSCGTRIRFIAWRDTDFQQETDGTIVKVCNSSSFYVRFDTGEGLKISADDVLEVLAQNKDIPLADEDDGVFYQTPDVVTRFFDNLSGR